MRAEQIDEASSDTPALATTNCGECDEELPPALAAVASKLNPEQLELVAGSLLRRLNFTRELESVCVLTVNQIGNALQEVDEAASGAGAGVDAAAVAEFAAAAVESEGGDGPSPGTAAALSTCTGPTAESGGAAPLCQHHVSWADTEPESTETTAAALDAPPPADQTRIGFGTRPPLM